MKRQSGHWVWSAYETGLVQAGAAEAFQIVLPLGVLLDRHLLCDPGERNIGLGATQFTQCGLGDFVLSGHAGGSGQHSMCADKIAALAESLARKTHRLLVVPPDELSIGCDAVVNRRERIARTQSDRTAGGFVCLLPAPAIGQRQTVITLRKRKIRIEP